MDKDLSPNGQNEPGMPVERPDDRPASAGPEVSVFLWQFLVRARDGDRAAFACFVNHITPGLSARFRSLGARERDLDDLIQDTLLKLYRGLPSFDPEGDYDRKN